MLRELLGVKQAWKSVIADLAVTVDQMLPEDVGFERFEGRCALGDLFKGVAHLVAGEAVGPLWMRNQIVERDFRWCGHGGQRSPLTCVHRQHKLDRKA